MTNPKDFCSQRGIPHPDRSAHEQPVWAHGIRALYDAVTQEPLPADFQTLLDKLGKLPRDQV